MLLMWADSEKNLRQSFVDDVVSVIYYPLIKFIDSLSKQVDSVTESLSTTNVEDLKKKYKLASNENRELRLRIITLERHEKKTRGYLGLLRAQREIREDVQLAEILRITVDRKKQIVKINLGRTSCVIDDQPLVDAYGVMGQVIRARPNESTVRLITDQNHIMHVQFESSPNNKEEGLQALARGTGHRNLIKLPYLPKSSAKYLKLGDKVFTSGLGDIYPRGYPVGIVTKIDTVSDPKFTIAYVKPAAHLYRTREAMVVWTAKVYKRMNLQYKNDLNSTRLLLSNNKDGTLRVSEPDPVKRAIVFGKTITCPRIKKIAPIEPVAKAPKTKKPRKQ